MAFLLAIGLMGSELTTQRRLNAELAQPIKQTFAPSKTISSSDLSQKFYALLPKNAETDAISERILQVADGMGLVFERAEFNALQSTESVLIQHQIKLPVKGSYVQIRQFLNALLNEQAALALTEMQLRRDDVFADMVEANLVLTLYLRKDVK